MADSHAIVAAALLFAATTTSVSTTSGSFVSFAAGPSGTVVSIVNESGGTSTFAVATGAIVRERALGGTWSLVSMLALKPSEPLRVLRNPNGEVVEIDAEYALVDTRAVVEQNGYLVGTDGVAHKLIADAASVKAIPLGAYVELEADPSTGDAFEAAVSLHPFARSGAAQAPAVAVTFEVRVPVNTPPDATVYIATNAQNWTASAIPLTAQPGNRWTATINLAGGTVLQYKYTRGSWATAERDASGADIPNRTLTVVAHAKSQSVKDVVVRWADLPS